jgi:DNA-binding NtrC family response regulator
LFGHARGAFTGAAAARAGLIEHASGGTLFLDEIGTMAAGVQAKLLRALESGEVRRIGENDPRRVDVRFVAATNTDLQGAVDAGLFRSDLFYRLNVHRIHLPPLRERREDIERLLEFFLDRFGPAAGITGVNDAARAALTAYDYPGNVRQLEHVVQRTVAVARGPVLEPGDLPEELFASRVVDPHSVAADGSVAAARERAEREMIVTTLARNNGEVSATARELQVSRTTLWRLMKKHQI